MNAIFGFLRARSCMILEARSVLAPMDDRHLGAEARQEGRLFHRGVAAADHHRVLVLEECAVAGRARADAVAHQRFSDSIPSSFADAPVAMMSASRLIIAAVRRPARTAACRRSHRGHVADHELRAEALGLAPEHVHHLGALDAVLEAGIVLDLGGDGELAAGLVRLRSAAARDWRAPCRARRSGRRDRSRESRRDRVSSAMIF